MEKLSSYATRGVIGVVTGGGGLYLGEFNNRLNAVESKEGVRYFRYLKKQKDIAVIDEKIGKLDLSGIAVLEEKVKKIEDRRKQKIGRKILKF